MVTIFQLPLRVKSILIQLLLLILITVNSVNAQTNEDCMMCHEDPELVKEVGGKSQSLFVNLKTLGKSPHKELDCTFCHEDAAMEEFPHPENLSKVKCGNCHDEADKMFMEGIHGTAFKAKAKYAPNCKECHGTHDILENSNPKSRTYKMNIPILCGNCHKEGAPVARTYNIAEHNIIENYSQSIHGKGLYQSGLIVTATCNDCHGNHKILPHTNKNSSISVNNIASTCMKCHARIEDVHVKVINKQLWEKKPGAIPACTDCHPPHIVNQQNIVESISDRSCLKCHEKEGTHKVVNGKKVSLTIDIKEFDGSKHSNIRCVKCHSDVTTKSMRPCETVGPVDCSACHQEASELYFSSGHGKAYFAKDEKAPYCTDCHGTHMVKSHTDDTSPTFRTAVPGLCGECHRTDAKAMLTGDLKETNALADYSKSVHGISLEKKGLLSAAICTDCHTSHFVLKESDERSTIHPLNVPKTCAKCHKGIYDDYKASDHSIFSNTGEKKYPTCVVCHSAHVISEISGDKFMHEITQQCGSCHKNLTETYMETYHGKAYTLGYNEAARCSDCHGAHKILNVRNPESMVSKENILGTCQQCHPDARQRFTGFLTHATHNNRDEYPALFYVYWGMTFLLVGVFLFFGIHTLLWLPRSLKERKRRQHKKPEGNALYIRRFKTRHRVTHIFVIISFMILALTGMMLKFANMPWANTLSEFLGGVKAAGNWHRFAAVLTFGYFAFHISALLYTKFKKGIKFKDFIFSSSSLMFNMQDLRDFGATIKWFVGRGPKPQYGRWTYWEKFDYMAVFWGVAVIGLSGLILWFPEIFTRFMPGWLINIAQIIHSDEALLAVGFIFTIHFFNTHFRPEAFPMDTVIFTGHIPYEEYKEDRPKEFEELEKSGKLKEVTIEMNISTTRMRLIKAFGYFFLSLGLILVVLIIYSLLFGSN
jgi:predicted CXXCH cytochrome family protein